ncbi:MAG: hypothetical protein A2700_02060 [Candidatus Blackburnbacteria bacterium RIFCSPHIGHO2_01_FULL_44_64]|uniref:Uncharacterized protein n=1 Tax=Candidatus Blackburnbacteria bacterium RIFCSPHIGHO2_02_FULL_44_20 TaxID=1797516 RepID=A0A1G1V7P2_9BACT|nr:MAG: hypothetical protein A2700_02060 [Candidatus Blackburnbacteria bacterium RIFCSPHIGHO2_01_FULL_44_64]OGY11187.1 MAG: hypothetical protein A3E16_00285 [Candidatus Blackburnbacteria bacterium RIFCSPHIGHO2_12_FULL_44_25]OGY11474.1 MAG: hypothetical protein A3D26_04595 [Candidatus Blackburnbacteria bacterium RIFCSPHIGHO2_02_FULL_44_20]
MTGWDSWLEEKRQERDAQRKAEAAEVERTEREAAEAKPAREAAEVRLERTIARLDGMVKRNLTALAELTLGADAPIEVHTDGDGGIRSWYVNLMVSEGAWSDVRKHYTVILVRRPPSYTHLQFVGGSDRKLITPDTSERSLQELLKAYYPNPSLDITEYSPPG